MATGLTYATFFSGSPITSTLPNGNSDLVYEVPANYDAEVDFLHIASGAGTNDINIKVYHYDDSTYTYILREFTMSNNNRHNVLDGGKIYLHAKDKIVAYKSGGSFDVSTSGRLFYNPSRGI